METKNSSEESREERESERPPANRPFPDWRGPDVIVLEDDGEY